MTALIIQEKRTGKQITLWCKSYKVYENQVEINMGGFTRIFNLSKYDVWEDE